ncbi:hypothetical protein NUSPORA_01609 [Nucleospora cyclopteri]
MSFLFPSLFAIARNDNSMGKPIREKLVKSVFVICTAPFSKGNKISVDGYSGTVEGMNLFYLKLRNYKRVIYIPTSFVYDKIIEKE